METALSVQDGRALEGAAGARVRVADPGCREVDSRARVAACFERCADAFCRFFAVRTGDDHLVDDLMQQLWLRARLAADALRAENAEPWLWRIARNLLHEARRRRGPELPRGAVPDGVLSQRLAKLLDTQDLPDAVLARRESRDQLLLGLTSLPAESQELLIGFYFEERSQAELARRYGVSERAIEGRLYRARAALRDRLAGAGEQEVDDV